MCYITLAQDSPEEYLDEHNKARAEVGVGPLKWNETIAAYALKYAKLMVEKNCDVAPSRGPYGESQALGVEMSGADAVTLWLSEKPNYELKSNKCVFGECSHYTQMVWRNSTDLGCASLKCPTVGVFIICNYSPPGNIKGETPY
ncbi:hypothetical protein RJT34_04272 [Clitoria ternatea]|uniref:SCP domain-containing protein n=1 Tax=Clitoria ternatea TaxID=43366 RepID=A0AAN9Q0F9_CLITE